MRTAVSRAVSKVVLMVVQLAASKDQKMAASKDQKMAALTAECWELKTVVMKVETTVGGLVGMKVVWKVVVMVVLLVVLLGKS